MDMKQVEGAAMDTKQTQSHWTYAETWWSIAESSASVQCTDMPFVTQTQCACS